MEIDTLIVNILIFCVMIEVDTDDMRFKALPLIVFYDHKWLRGQIDERYSEKTVSRGRTTRESWLPSNSCIHDSTRLVTSYGTLGHNAPWSLHM